ncbi:MAG: ArsR family transcriptional regulator, partial [Candidatus Bathyarchaeota archaeon]|nr:ArsR family transcriptional regulator [Candidatus Bathyarchaeota archaeon]
MNGTPNDTQLGTRTLASPKAISELLKSAAHPARIHVLALLMQGHEEFAKLMQHTKLSKTALANHLKRLANMGLIQRISRGKYTLTADGQALLNAVSAVYQNSMRREERQREALRSRYTTSMVEGRILKQKAISKETVYQPCWLSYTGAMAGSLKALGVDCDIVDVGGSSGYAFLINVSKGITCPSGPTALGEAWSHIHKATESLGWTLDRYAGGSPCYPGVEGKPTPDEIERAKTLFARVKQEIAVRDRPAVLWGLVAPEYGIVTGYRGEAYLASTFRHLVNQPEDPIPFYDLQAPGGLEAFFFRDKTKPSPALPGRGTLENAVRFAEAKDPPPDNYVAGPEALDEWANVLENLPE